MRCSIIVCVLSISVGVGSAEPANDQAAEGDESLFQCVKPKGRLKIEFKPELELGELVTWASSFSCEAILVSSAISNRKLHINIIAPKMMSSGAAWSLFQIALRSMNLALVAKGGINEIVEAPEGKGQPLPLISDRGNGGGRGLARTLISAEFITGSELASVLTALKSKAGDVTALAGTELVLVTDYADHIAKMAELLVEIDRGHAENEGIYVIAVEHADVAELAATIEAILGSDKQTGAPVRPKAGKPPVVSEGRANAPRSILAEPRTRSIVVVASRSAFSRARALIKRLDVRVEEQSSHIHMIGLEHADAEALASTITALMSARQSAAAVAAKNRTAKRPASDGVIAVEGDVRVTHDAPTNSLLVLATMRDFLSIREVVRRLDSTRPQVYIEATIMEVSVTSDRDLGGSFHLGGQEGGGTWLAGLQQSDLRSTNIATLLGATGLLGGVFGGALTGVEFLGQSIPSYGVLFQAIATNRRANLLSSPRIMTSDNTAATIRIAESRREFGATTVTATGLSNRSIETVVAALTLKVTPHVNATDEVKLDIELVLEEFLPSRSAELGSDKSSREITNTVVVRDQESVIIGGLMVERQIKSESKVPLLGDVPLLGYFFKSTRNEKEKRNLVVLLTPYVLDSRADHNHLVRRALAERGDFMRAHMNLSSREPEPNVDYRKKRGLLETINQRAAAMERERAELDSIKDNGSQAGEEGPF